MRHTAERVVPLEFAAHTGDRRRHAVRIHLVHRECDFLRLVKQAQRVLCISVKSGEPAECGGTSFTSAMNRPMSCFSLSIPRQTFVDHLLFAGRGQLLFAGGIQRIFDRRVRCTSRSAICNLSINCARMSGSNSGARSTFCSVNFNC